MRTKIFLTSTLFIFLMAGYANVVEPNYELFEVSNELTKAEINQNAPIVMKGIIYDGEVVPFRALPEVEIRGNRNPEALTKAKIVNGEVLSVIELSEVVITARM